MNRSKAALAGFALSAAALAAAMGAGLGSRMGEWEFRTGFRILNWAAYLGVAGFALSVAGAVLARPGSGRRGFALAAAGALLGAVTFGVPAKWYWTAMHVPMIHDISTDTENPPQFVSILPIRKDAPNSVEYGGPEIAARQHAAYPDIRPVETALPLSKAYEYAYDTARGLGWQIVDGSREQGRIEATDTTRWFGFKDDIVIRISHGGGSGSRLDIRSVSRVGISDVGTNACRIRAFEKNFAARTRSAG